MELFASCRSHQNFGPCWSDHCRSVLKAERRSGWQGRSSRGRRWCTERGNQMHRQCHGSRRQNKLRGWRWRWRWAAVFDASGHVARCWGQTAIRISGWHHIIVRQYVVLLAVFRLLNLFLFFLFYLFTLNQLQWAEYFFAVLLGVHVGGVLAS